MKSVSDNQTVDCCVNFV